MMWWIATTAPSREKRAQADLEALGLETWLPLRATSVKARHMKLPEWRTYPAYPGYVLVRAEGDCDWHIVRSVEHVGRILTNEGRPLSLRDDQMSRLAASFVCSTLRLVEGAWRIGERVYISEGPFQSFTACIASVLKGEQIALEIEMMGRKTRVVHEVSQLERVA